MYPFQCRNLFLRRSAFPDDRLPSAVQRFRFISAFSRPRRSLCPAFLSSPGLSASCLIAAPVSKTTSARPLSPSPLPYPGSFLGCSARLPHRPPPARFSLCRIAPDWCFLPAPGFSPRLLLTIPFLPFHPALRTTRRKTIHYQVIPNHQLNRWFAHILKGETTSQPVNGYPF